ncbi:unnamed protein product [Symbiodinium sp. CCMP2456]|nr:unnamed protein product [Symbiodinium sp. CCMP2456]
MPQIQGSTAPSCLKLYRSLASTVAPAWARSFRPGTINGWILWAQNTEIYDPPWCAERTACMISDIVDAAQQVVAMTGDCMGELEEPANCANDIFAFLYDIADACGCAAGLAMGCAGKATTCEQGAFFASEDTMSVAQDLIGAAGNCDVDVFLCLINVVDALNDMLTMALDTKSAVDSCPQEREGFLKKWLRQEHPEWFQYRVLEPPQEGQDEASPEEDKAQEVRLSRSYKAELNSDHLATFQDATTRLGVIDVTHNGPILAMDNAGVLRVGSAYVMPYGNSQINPNAMRGGRNSEGRRLSAQDQQPSQLMTLHDTEVEVFYMGDLGQPEEGFEGFQAFE